MDLSHLSSGSTEVAVVEKSLERVLRDLQAKNRSNKRVFEGLGRLAEDIKGDADPVYFIVRTIKEAVGVFGEPVVTKIIRNLSDYIQLLSDPEGLEYLGRKLPRILAVLQEM